MTNDKLKTESETATGREASAVKRLVMWFYYHIVLIHLIERNYKLRYKSAINGDDKYPDTWYWADKLAVKYGYYTYRPPEEVLTISNLKAIKFLKDRFFNRYDI